MYPVANILIDVAGLVEIPDEDHTIIGAGCDLFAG